MSGADNQPLPEIEGPDISKFLFDLDDHDHEQYNNIWSNGVRTAYLAGPMRGYVEYNYPLFNAVAERLEMIGYRIENPAASDGEVHERAQKSAHPLSVYMERDLADVAKTDAVFVLPGWRDSEGAVIEVTVAEMLSHPVYELPTYKRVSVRSDTRAEVTALPTGSEERKGRPITTGVLDYFPAAIAAVAAVSKAGNDKHNPGEPLHWARGKSMDQADCLARHLIERGGFDPETGMRHTAQLAWRALALLQIELEEAGEAPMARGAGE